MRVLLVAVGLLISITATAASRPAPHECWFGVMVIDGHKVGSMVATGSVAEWKPGTPITVYPTIETDEEVLALIDKLKSASFNLSAPISIVPEQIAGPEPQDDGIVVQLTFHTKAGESAILDLTYWKPMDIGPAQMSDEAKDAINNIEWEMHDSSCRNVP